ncbi:DUF6890 family protein [Aliivibrio sifiae]
MIFRRSHLPNEDDSEDSLARALWLEKHRTEQLAKAVASGLNGGPK